MPDKPRSADDGARGAGGPIVFVSDSSAEAERIGHALRAAGATVVDVPLSVLVARVAVQTPLVVVVDADSHGALDVVARIRDLPQADDVQVIFVAAPGGAIATLQDALAHEGNAFFPRPIDVPALVRAVESAAGRPHAPAERSRSSAPPSPDAVASGHRSSVPPSLPPPSIRSASLPPESSEGEAVASPRSPTPAASPAALGMAPTLSPELRQLLADADKRTSVPSVPVPSAPAPSPEQELEAILPADVLASLDEPLEEDDEADVSPATHGPAALRPVREATSDGGAHRTTGASTGGGATPSAGSHPTTSEVGVTPSPPSARDRGRAPSQRPDAPTGGNDVPSQWPAAPPKTIGPQAPPTLFSAPNESGRDAPTYAIRSELARAVVTRTSGALCFVADEIERRIVLRDGDLLTCVSTAEDESLIAFLGARGDLPRETVRRLALKFPPYGRHAGAALVARGYLLQSQMWPTLRAHAEWVLGHVLQARSSRVIFEAQVPGKLAGEPGVFGGSAGAEIFVEVVRRVVSPSDAIERLGGAGCRVENGPASDLLGECALGPQELAMVGVAAGRTVGEILGEARDSDFASLLFALSELGIIDAIRPAEDVEGAAGPPSAEAAALDADAIRERVRARLQVVDDGDYFAVLGVPREATGYEIRRAFLELRRAFDPSRLLPHDLADLSEDVRKIASVLEEAYDVLKDSARRERYRRAIEVSPE